MAPRATSSLILTLTLLFSTIFSAVPVSAGGEGDAQDAVGAIASQNCESSVVLSVPHVPLLSEEGRTGGSAETSSKECIALTSACDFDTSGKITSEWSYGFKNWRFGKIETTEDSRRTFLSCEGEFMVKVVHEGGIGLRKAYSAIDGVGTDANKGIDDGQRRIPQEDPVQTQEWESCTYTYIPRYGEGSCTTIHKGQWTAKKWVAGFVEDGATIEVCTDLVVRNTVDLPSVGMLIGGDESGERVCDTTEALRDAADIPRL